MERCVRIKLNIPYQDGVEYFDKDKLERLRSIVFNALAGYPTHILDNNLLLTGAEITVEND